MQDLRLAGRKSAAQRTLVQAGDVCIGGDRVVLIAGPCTIGAPAETGEILRALGGTAVAMVRGGAWKPRTSPWSYQGPGLEGLQSFSRAAAGSGYGVVTEVMEAGCISQAEPLATMLQVGSRNMQNFDLLRALGRSRRPVLLKRGLSATLSEFLYAAEYILAGGNPSVVLCERGIRSFDDHTRNVLDLGAVVALKQLTHLPVIVDPSHACGRREMVADLSLAAVACGADGLLIEAHPRPEQSISDARQTISTDDLAALCPRLEAVAATRGRHLADRREKIAVGR